MPTFVSSQAAQCAEKIIDRVGKDVRIAVPIGIGKPVILLDALYQLACADRSIHLSIFTGLTLTRPDPKSSLEARFVGPFLDRTLGTYRAPLYVADQKGKGLPRNISVHEFFLQAGVWTKNGAVQREYTSLNYSHVAAHLARAETNVFGQLVAPAPDGQGRISLGSNTDITVDMFPYIAHRRQSGLPVAVACEIHPQMPYMRGAAEVDLAEFDICLQPPESPDLFSAPKQPVSLHDYAMALHAATLVRDGGTLQIGIGTFGDALTHALVLRQHRNETFRDLLSRLGAPPHPDAQLEPFAEGLYGCTEMMVDGYLALVRAGILKREVTDADGVRSVLDAGFFVGNRRFYEDLTSLSDAHHAMINMRGISYTNTLHGDTDRKRQARRHARFVNTALAVTALGATSSDAAASGQVISGVGGQLDLVNQAHLLPEARSIIAVRSTRRSPFRTVSNIAWSHANCTVPRSLRDIFVSEYGIADVRGRSDRDTVAAMIGIADADFQPALVAAAKKTGKLKKNFVLGHRRNAAERIEHVLEPYRRQDVLPLFPHGTEMTEVECMLVQPLSDIGTMTPGSLITMLMAAIAPANAAERAALARLELEPAASLKERVMRRIVLGALRQSQSLRNGA